MNVHPSPDQDRLIRKAIAAGRFNSAEDAIMDALALWEEREHRRADVLAAIDEAETSLARGEGQAITQEAMRALTEGVKQRGRAGLSAERHDRR
ncbi:MAG: type II toxin-antitoxin system ParD family antitoxin [Acetobacteraceae bacterium]|nr:type II toxin-antitoxin system ParD family antitoxin [Acetobacteraceae bacterium]